jgi:Prokaryotic cytochrome b561
MRTNISIDQARDGENLVEDVADCRLDARYPTAKSSPIEPLGQMRPMRRDRSDTETAEAALEFGCFRVMLRRRKLVADGVPIMAVCILAMLFIGVGMVSTIMPKYLTLVSIHKPLGMAILVLALIRLAVRLRYGAPPLPANLPEPIKLAAHLSHYALYILMIGMPLLGWGMLSAAAYPVVLFGGVHLPAILPQSDGLQW